MPRVTFLNLYTLYVSRAVAVLGAACALSVFLYGFFLLEAVSHAASLTLAERRVAELTGTVAELQSQYLAQTKELTLERAAKLGFVAPEERSTIVASQDKPLSLR